MCQYAEMNYLVVLASSTTDLSGLAVIDVTINGCYTLTSSQYLSFHNVSQWFNNGR
jgi:hypothetical protein